MEETVRVLRLQRSSPEESRSRPMRAIGRGRNVWGTYPKPPAVGGSSDSSVTAWAFYTPTFDVIGSAGAQLGDGLLIGRFKQNGPDSIQVQQILEWGATTSWGAAPVPTYNLTVPPGYQLTLDNVLTSPAGINGVVPVGLCGVLGGVVSQGSTFFCSIFDFGGLKALIGIPAAIKALFQQFDTVEITLDLTIVPP